MVTATAAVMREEAEGFRIEALDVAEPGFGEVRVRIVGSGICVHDLAARKQLSLAQMPAILGHEGAGIVEAVGPGVGKVRPGDAVVLTFASCGSCAHCLRARYSYCTRIDGGVRAVPGLRIAGRSSFASYALASERSIVRIPSDVPVELMGPLGCAVQAGAGAVINVLKPAPGSGIAVFGVGTVGMSALMAAKALGCGVVVAVDRNAERLTLARTLGATHVFNTQRSDIAQQIRSISDDGVQSTVESTGDASLLRLAVSVLRTTGTCAMLGRGAAGAEISLPIDFMLSGRTLRGVLDGDSIPDLFIPELIDLWRQGRFPFDRLVRFYDLADINKAIDAASRGVVLKPIVRPAPW